MLKSFNLPRLGRFLMHMTLPIFKKKIFCISPPRINVAGKTKICCFDKTGTLTEEGLDFWGLLRGDDLNAESILKNPKIELPNSSPLKHCMAACHSLTTIDGEFIGDPLDIKMFEVKYRYL